MTSSQVLNRSMRFFIPGFFVLGVLLVTQLGAASQTRIDSTDAGLRLKSYEKHMAMKETSIFQDLKWRNLGPDIISGRCTDIAVPRGDKHTIYVLSLIHI